MHPFLVQRSVVLVFLAVITLSPVGAMKDQPLNGEGARDDEKSVLFTKSIKPSEVKAYDRTTQKDRRSGVVPGRNDLFENLLKFLKAKPQRIHLDSQARNNSEYQAFLSFLNDDERYTAPWTREQRIDYQRFVGCRHRVRSLGIVTMKAEGYNLNAELTRIMEDRLKLVKMVDIDYYRRRLMADSPQALISKMNKLMQPEQAYVIHETMGDWDPYQRQYKGGYLAVVLNRPNALIARLPDPGVFAPAGNGGSFRRGDNIIHPEIMTTDPGKILPVNPGHWIEGEGYHWTYQGHGGNYRRGAHFNVASKIKPDPGLFAPAAHFAYSRRDSHDHVSFPEPQAATGVSQSSSHSVEGMTQQESLRKERRAIAAYVDTQGLISTRRGTYEGYIAQYKWEIKKDRALRSRDISRIKGFDNESKPYRRGYHDNITSSLFSDQQNTYPTWSKDYSYCYSTGMVQRRDLFNVPREDLYSYRRNANIDPGKFEPVTGECYAWRWEYSPDGTEKWVQQRAGDTEYIWPGYHDNFAPAYTSDPGRTLPIGDAPTAHFMRPTLTVADLNEVIGRFKHVELIGE